MAGNTPTDVAPDSKAGRLERYLYRRARDGSFYFKSREITDEVGLSAKEIGAIVATLREQSDSIVIERWGYTRGTTWYVERT